MSTLLAKASALTLRKHPILNASYGKDSIIYHDGIHIAMAVALPDGGKRRSDAVRWIFIEFTFFRVDNSCFKECRPRRYLYLVQVMEGRLL